MFSPFDGLKSFFGYDRTSAARKRKGTVHRPCLVELLEKRLVLSSVTGEWQGTLTEPVGFSTTQFDLQMDLVQTQQSVKGTSHHTIPGNSQSYLNTNLGGTVTNSTFTFHDLSITSQVPPPGGSWLLISGTLQISANGNALTGTWVSGGYHGDISLNKDVAQSPDLSMTSATISANGVNVNAAYAITGDYLPSAGTIAFYWASGPTLSDKLETSPLKTVPTGVNVDSYTVSVPITSLGQRPAQAVYILAVADSPYADSKHDVASVSDPFPHIIITDLPSNGIFYIGANLNMPIINASLVGITPDPGTKLTWNTEIDYVAANYPAISGIRGTGSNESTTYPAYKTSGTQYTPNFKDEIGNTEVRGGDLTITVNAVVGGKTIQVQTNEDDNELIVIEGTNPTPQLVHNFIATELRIPANWPSSTSYNYYTIVRKIISDESSVRQFYDGEPLWSQDNLHGAGLMQLTNPAPSLNDVWNWQSNIIDGVSIFVNQKLPTAISRLTTLYNQGQSEAASLGAKAAPITGDMIVLEAIRGFNGYNNGAGIIDEWQPARNAAGKLIVSKGYTQWQRVPVANRTIGVSANAIKGVPNYVNDVLNASDF